MQLNKHGELKKENLEKELSNNINKNFKVYTDNDSYVVCINERVYKVDFNGKVELSDNSILQSDLTPGGFDGTGSPSDPFIIMSIEDLVYLSKISNTETTLKNKYIKIGRNLDFKSELSYCNYETREYNEYLEVTDDVGLMEALTNEKYNGFVPNKVFSGGTLDGDGKIIKNIYIKKDGDVGLFKADSSTSFYIKNLELTGKIVCNGNSCGSFIPSGIGTYENLISRVNIIATGNSIYGIAGGVTSIECKNYGDIEGKNNVCGIGLSKAVNCENYGNITGSQEVGGITGLYGTASNCKNFGVITADSGAGGINGWYANISNCKNYGTVTANNTVGGISGYARSIVIENSINYAEVNSNAGAGGIVRKLMRCKHN